MTHPLLIDHGKVAPILQYLGPLSTMIFPNDPMAIHTYLTSITRIFGMETSFLAEITDDILTVRYAATSDTSSIPVQTPIPLHETFCRYVRASGLPVIIPDVAHDVRMADIAVPLTCPIGSYLGVPVLLTNGTLYGTLCASDPNPHALTPDHVTFLQVIAQYLAAIVERTQVQDLVSRADHESTTDLLVTLNALDSQIALMQVVAHDVRSPLTTISGYAELFEVGAFGDLTLQQREAFTHVQQASRLVTRLMDDLLDMHSLQQQTMAVIAEEFDAIALAQHVIAAYQHGVDATRVRLDFTSMVSTLSMIGDRDRLHQVLLNLLGNAVRYTTQGWIRLTVRPIDDEVEFWVEDSGPGIAADLQPIIWTRHIRGNTTTKGFGLGLYVVQRLVDLMEGSIELESEIGRGSRFVIRLPRRRSSSQRLSWA